MPHNYVRRHTFIILDFLDIFEKWGLFVVGLLFGFTFGFLIGALIVCSLQDQELKLAFTIISPLDELFSSSH